MDQRTQQEPRKAASREHAKEAGMFWPSAALAEYPSYAPADLCQPSRRPIDGDLADSQRLLWTRIQDPHLVLLASQRADQRVMHALWTAMVCRRVRTALCCSGGRCRGGSHQSRRGICCYASDPQDDPLKASRNLVALTRPSATILKKIRQLNIFCLFSLIC
ncbi:hypothetical protein MJO28_003919 [Puccinia striiformis f. sp. tritici]|uniref:Uncharacterized protein n=1 Tax=Puccinia striiformis f. sp. tritici TaxID=168172 RepID=A0ACC0EMH8_9BASI|nr:hypothetical protein MJO28_003919 [Puccinia striiformis f. sp. tritici]